MDPFSLDHIFSCSSFHRLPRRIRFARRCHTQAHAPTVASRFVFPVPDGQTRRILHSSAATSPTGHPPQRHHGILPSLELSKNTVCICCAALVEVWGLEPQTYGLQSHRSSH